MDLSHDPLPRVTRARRGDLKQMRPEHRIKQLKRVISFKTSEKFDRLATVHERGHHGVGGAWLKSTEFRGEMASSKIRK
jgi:hypothetical protein